MAADSNSYNAIYQAQEGGDAPEPTCAGCGCDCPCDSSDLYRLLGACEGAAIVLRELGYRKTASTLRAAAAAVRGEAVQVG